MQLNFTQWYKQYGVVTPKQLFTPRLFRKERLAFPKNSAYHFISHDPTVTMPDTADQVFKNYRGTIYIDHVTQLTSMRGMPRRKNLVLQNLLHPFHQAHHNFKYIKDPELKVKDPMALEVYNYAPIQRTWQYMANKITPYNQWFNIEKTAWNHIVSLAESGTRQQMVVVNLPDVLPSIQSIRNFGHIVNNQLLKVFNTPAKRFILELWRWLEGHSALASSVGSSKSNGLNRADTIFGDISADAMAKINIVFQYKGVWTVLNLDYLNSWCKGVKLQPGVRRPQLELIVIQKLFLKLCLGVQTIGAKGAAEVEQEAEAQAQQDEAKANKVLDTDEGGDEGEDETPESGITEPSDPYKAPEVDKNQYEYISNVAADGADELEAFDTSEIEALLTEVDKDLEAVEFIERQNHLQRGVSLKEEEDEETSPSKDEPSLSVFEQPLDPDEQAALEDHVFNEKDPNQALKDQIEAQAAYGLMSAQTLRETMKLADKINTIESPHKAGVPLVEFAQVTPEMTKIDTKETELNVPDTVIDKTMGQSTLQVMDQKYVKQVLPKDVSAMIVHLQKGGVIIQNYTIVKETSVLGEVEKHTVTLKPVDGVTSTVTFKLPVVDGEGNVKINSNKYLLRKQKSEIPLRKVSPSMVALTSYYGKVFIERSEKKAYDTHNWLANQINSLSTSVNPRVTSVNPANVFSNTFKCPRIYSSLAKFFKSFMVDGHLFVFDCKLRMELVPEEILEMLESTQSPEIKGKPILAGMSKDRQPILVDDTNTFFIYRDGQVEKLGNIYDILLIDQTLTPVESVDLNIFGKSMPIGVALGYYLGLSNLIKLLKVTPRVFDVKKRVTLASDEFALIFQDQKLIFSRSNPVASLILGGFKQYHRSLLSYRAEDFNDRDVYLNVLEAQGLSGRMLRELDTMNDLFVDPITRDILLQMHEPVVFKALLLRGVEMLTNDQHPDANDMAYMRVKGYERFAGTIYKELTGAIKDYKARNIRGRSQIELDPYKVWKTVTQDAAMKLVEEINPIQNLKEQEVITYVGNGGRSKSAMDKQLITYHQTDMGVVSEATVDSGDVGVNTFLSGNPQFTSIRGIAKPMDAKELTATTLLSTSALLAPGAVNDDPKRV